MHVSKHVTNAELLDIRKQYQGLSDDESHKAPDSQIHKDLQALEADVARAVQDLPGGRDAAMQVIQSMLTGGGRNLQKVTQTIYRASVIGKAGAKPLAAAAPVQDPSMALLASDPSQIDPLDPLNFLDPSHKKGGGDPTLTSLLEGQPAASPVMSPMSTASGLVPKPRTTVYPSLPNVNVSLMDVTSGMKMGSLFNRQA